MLLTDLTQRIHENIPTSQYYSFQLAKWEGGVLTVTAPLEGNNNDKGTFFAGSQVALSTLSGWALTTLLAEQTHEPNVDVVAVETTIRYLKPLEGQAILRAEAKNIKQFQRRFVNKKRAVLSLTVCIMNEAGEVTTEFNGRYFATQKG